MNSSLSRPHRSGVETVGREWPEEPAGDRDDPDLTQRLLEANVGSMTFLSHSGVAQK